MEGESTSSFFIPNHWNMSDEEWAGMSEFAQREIMEIVSKEEETRRRILRARGSGDPNSKAEEESRPHGRVLTIGGRDSKCPVRPSQTDDGTAARDAEPSGQKATSGRAAERDGGHAVRRRRRPSSSAIVELPRVCQNGTWMLGSHLNMLIDG